MLEHDTQPAMMSPHLAGNLRWDRELAVEASRDLHGNRRIFQTCFPAAGDCLWFYQGKNMMYGLSDELWEVGLFYADGGRIFGPLGWTPSNIFGRMTENLDAFAAECADIRLSGAKVIEVGQWSEVS